MWAVKREPAPSDSIHTTQDSVPTRNPAKLALVTPANASVVASAKSRNLGRLEGSESHPAVGNARAQPFAGDGYERR